MERSYAGILGLVASCMVIVRGIFLGGGTESTLLAAWAALVVFAGLGYFVGWLACRTIDDSVRQRVAEELASREVAVPNRTTKAAA